MLTCFDLKNPVYFEGSLRTPSRIFNPPGSTCEFTDSNIFKRLPVYYLNPLGSRLTIKDSLRTPGRDFNPSRYRSIKLGALRCECEPGGLTIPSGVFRESSIFNPEDLFSSWNINKKHICDLAGWAWRIEDSARSPQGVSYGFWQDILGVLIGFPKYSDRISVAFWQEIPWVLSGFPMYSGRI